MHFLVTGVHPQLVDTKIGKPLLKEAIEHFPEWSEKDVSRLLNFQILVIFQYGVFSVCNGGKIISRFLSILMCLLQEQ